MKLVTESRLVFKNGNMVNTGELGAFIAEEDLRGVKVPRLEEKSLDRIGLLNNTLFFQGVRLDPNLETHVQLEDRVSVKIISTDLENYPYKIEIEDFTKGNAIYSVFLGEDNQYYQHTRMGQIPTETRQRVEAVIETSMGPRKTELNLEPLPKDITRLVDSYLKKL